METVFNSLLYQVLPIVENWLRDTVRDEMERALVADREKQQPEKMIDREKVAKLLGISLTTLWSKTKSGQINCKHIGRRVLYPESEIKRLLNS